jgi:hypothetical protein
MRLFIFAIVLACKLSGSWWMASEESRHGVQDLGRSRRALQEGKHLQRSMPIIEKLVLPIIMTL